ncbi:MAG: hypothetical protein E7531_02440 [Ruminococcaceae bacterium]|nr:hypothetical protein [Oscillospiraceae bacterium]
MQYFLYKHTKEDFVKDFDEPGYFDYDDDVCVFPAFHYCENCNTEILGLWEFYNLYTYAYTKYKKYSYSERALYKNRGEADANKKKIDFNLEVFINGKIYDDENLKDLCSFSLLSEIELKFYEEEDFEENVVDCRNISTYKRYDYVDKPLLKTLNDYTVSKEYRLILQYRNEMINFINLDVCPVCGKKIVDNSFHQVVPTCVVGRICYPEKNFSLEQILNSSKKERENLFCDLSVKKFDDFSQKNSSFASETIENVDCTDLKKYLFHLMNLENGIFSLSQRLKYLYEIGIVADKDAMASEKIHLMSLGNKHKEALRQYEEFKNSRNSKALNLDDIPIILPQKPIKPLKPETPILYEAGLFNKKKIKAQNIQIMQEYENELSLFEEEEIKYKAELATYYNEIERLKAEQKESYQREIDRINSEYEEKLTELKIKYENALLEFDKLKDDAKSFVTQEKVLSDFINKEITNTENMLRNFYEARNKMYSYNIVYSKYRDLVSVATFYEYFDSGRCKELEGSDGAYNIYENEIRMNTVVSQLTQIIESLEQVKQNQYMIYTAIQETNRLLSSLNASMNKAVSSLSAIKNNTTDMKTYMSQIADNTEVIAYNTEVAAFYSKKNAELTNALGYMVALS